MNQVFPLVRISAVLYNFCIVIMKMRIIHTQRFKNSRVGKFAAESYRVPILQFLPAW